MPHTGYIVSHNAIFFFNGKSNPWFIFMDFSLIIPIILLDQNPWLLFLFLLRYVSRAQWIAHQPKLQKVLSLKLGQATLGLCQDNIIHIWHIKHVELCALLYILLCRHLLYPTGLWEISPIWVLHLKSTSTDYPQWKHRKTQSLMNEFFLSASVLTKTVINEALFVVFSYYVLQCFSAFLQLCKCSSLCLPLNF